MEKIKRLKIRGLLFVLLMAIASLQALAEEVAVEGIRYLINRKQEQLRSIGATLINRLL